MTTIPFYALGYMSLVGAILVAFFYLALRAQARQVRPPRPRLVWSQLDTELGWSSPVTVTVSYEEAESP